MNDAADRWNMRRVPADLVQRYTDDGWWTDDTLGSVVATGLADLADRRFAVHSAMRPFDGTFGEIDRAARSLAASLHADGVGPGDVVAFQLPNWVEAAITFWGAAYLGATVVPIVHFYGPKEVSYILDVVDPAAIITASSFGPIDYLASYKSMVTADQRWYALAQDGGTLPSNARPFESLLEAEPLSEPLAVGPDTPAVIAFTSGTTRDPKGVIHTHRTILCETRQLDQMSPTSGPAPITGAPVGHFIGMANALLTSLLRGQEVHLVDVWDPGNVLALMKQHHLSMGGGATYFVTSLLDHPDFTNEHLALMPTAGLGGSPVPYAVTRRLADLGITSYRSYGSTEHPSITRSRIDAPEEKRLATDGDVIPGVEMRLDDEGEISSRGPDLCLGYTDPELTAAAFDEQGWYRTGDVGILDSDAYLTITDRVSDIIIRGGENVSAQEVEEELMALPGVAEVCVVAAPDDRFGEHACAILRMLPDTAAPSLADMREHLTAVGLAKQKWPESVRHVADFPRTPSGKVQKYRLRQQIRDSGLENEIGDAEYARPPAAPLDPG
ncbi:MAG: AMP-binding protein [Acidimicrobiales bacterium]|jgi:acyl-CoA synthetase (AMP-forming)/AMP-acid ligase II|nr:AMP-binding protein [Acidimicrobiales bacterium]